MHKFLMENKNMFIFSWLQIYGGVFNSRQLHHFELVHAPLIQGCGTFKPPTNHPRNYTNSRDFHTNFIIWVFVFLAFNESRLAIPSIYGAKKGKTYMYRGIVYSFHVILYSAFLANFTCVTLLTYQQVNF